MADEALGFDLDAEIVGLIQRHEVHVPPFPGVAVRLLELTSSGDFGLDDAAKIIAADQVLTASVIRYASSAFYAGATPVQSPLQALQRIGAKQLLGVALADALKSEAARTGPLYLLRRSLWRRGVASALVAQTLAPHHAVNEADAFLAGLLHDFGELVALSCIELLLQRRPGPALAEEKWLEIIERYHVELGLVTAAQWQLPSFVSDAIASHAEGSERPELVELILSVDLIVPKILERPQLTEAELSVIPGLDPRDVETLLRMLPQIPSMLASFTQGEASGKPEPSRIAPPEQSALAPPEHPMSFPIMARIGPAHEELYRAVAISRTGLRMRGPVPLEERRALEIRLEPAAAPALSIWAQVRRCTAEGKDHLLEVTPFAMNREQGKAWHALVPRTGPAPARE